MPHAVITIGPPAVGKTRYVSRFVGYTTVNSDTLNDDIYPPNFHQQLRENFGKNLIVDGCNHLAVQRFAIIKLLQQEDYKIAGYYFDMPCDNDRLRSDDSLRRKAVKVKREMCRPQVSEGFDTLEFVHSVARKTAKPKRKAVFFNVDLAVTVGAVGLANLLNEYANDGFALIALGNQDDCPQKDYQEYLLRVIRALRCDITDLFYCHHSGFCDCRFPKTALAHNAAKRYSLDLQNCIMLCVDDVDMEFGKKLGMSYYRPPNASWLDRGVNVGERDLYK